ncbi:probable CCR4-associated factor 1 homolog 11 [Vicia villosa]|uniref:probable CCR4-associated factor 1 homolog 11 n=1 Tax=Vicia villosa TaxID=3911 RepID=UPI00273C70CD|nr:probable CCR4-associated factor 1 homolog 11 [Vicia villosa]XP_058731996.1 probable CCR4-associated factor 1 homolog 11 [Vicia villosa]
MRKAKEVIIRQVWAYNLEYEFNLIRQAIYQHPVVSMDTEFPGVIHSSKIDRHYLQSSDNYHYLKANVDALKLIQVGLTLTDFEGNLPDFGSIYSYIWEFNFCDFDINHDPCNQDSIDMLRRQGIDFNRNFRYGVNSMHFADLMLSSGLVFNKSIVWITFSSAYDFGYLVKILTRKNLPNYLEEFLNIVEVLFGKKVFDMKHMIKFCDSLHGGLERVAAILKVGRVVGKSHQAGSDSLLTCQTFRKMIETHFIDNEIIKFENLAGVLFGLERVV